MEGQYCLSLFSSDDAFYSDHAAIAEENTMMFATDGYSEGYAAAADARLVLLTEEAARDAAAFPVPPRVCTNPDCRDTFTTVFYREGVRLWGCGTPSCSCFGGLPL